jgi:hypothetical protein
VSLNELDPSAPRLITRRRCRRRATRDDEASTVGDGLEAAQGDELPASALLAPLFWISIRRTLGAIARVDAHVDPADPHACSSSTLSEDLPHHAVDESRELLL